MLETKLHDSKNEFGVITNFPHAQMGEKQNAPLVLGMQPGIEETVVLNEGEEVSAKHNAGDENLYFCQHLTGGASHPGIIVETAGLANIKPPRPVYRPRLSVELVRGGKISQIQLERIIYAGQAHRQRLPESAARGNIYRRRHGSRKNRHYLGNYSRQLVFGTEAHGLVQRQIRFNQSRERRDDKAGA